MTDAVVLVVVWLAYQGVAHRSDHAAVFVVGLVVVLGGFIALRVARGSADELGLRRDARGLPAALAIGLVGASAMAAWGASAGTLVVDRHLGFCLATYPLFGFVQQFLVQDLLAPVVPARGRVLVTAALFGAAHWPNGRLMAATFALGLATTAHFLAYRNLWPLALVHGWLGALLYFWVFGRDPWYELFG